MRDDPKIERARAEALFKKKEEQMRQGAKAMAEYKAEQQAVQEKTLSFVHYGLRAMLLHESPPVIVRKRSNSGHTGPHCRIS